MIFFNKSFFVAISKFVNTWIYWLNLIWFNNSSIKISSFKIQKLTKTLIFEIILIWTIFKIFNEYIIKKTLFVFKINAKYKFMFFSYFTFVDRTMFFYLKNTNLFLIVLILIHNYKIFLIWQSNYFWLNCVCFLNSWLNFFDNL